MPHLNIIDSIVLWHAVIFSIYSTSFCILYNFVYIVYVITRITELNIDPTFYLTIVTYLMILYTFFSTLALEATNANKTFKITPICVEFFIKKT